MLKKTACEGFVFEWKNENCSNSYERINLHRHLFTAWNCADSFAGLHVYTRKQTKNPKGRDKTRGAAGSASFFVILY